MTTLFLASHLRLFLFFMALFILQTIPSVDAKGGHSMANSVGSQNCKNGCTSDYNRGVLSCQQQTGVSQSEKDNCSQAVAIVFLRCAGNCIPDSELE